MRLESSPVKGVEWVASRVRGEKPDPQSSLEHAYFDLSEIRET